MNQDERQLFTQSIGKNRKSLLQGYLQHKRSILIGTSSFWEGVDLPGDKVELLILMKIPFASPGDPIIQSQIDYYKMQSRNPFMEFQVPDATVRLKQGFGRLIRSLEDSGICMIVDPRVTKSRYGKVILDSLPVQAQLYEHSSRIIYEAESFFGNS
jgi:ATP-dependent DNA helicase DinG